MSTKLVAEQFEISRLQVQQLAKEYRDARSIPMLEIPGQKPHATHPDDRSSRALAVHEMCGGGAVTVVKVPRVRDDVSLATNTFPEILTEYNNVTKNTNKPGRQRLWARFERDHLVVTVHMDWNRNERNQQVVAIEDDTSRYVFDMLETDNRLAARNVEYAEGYPCGIRNRRPRFQRPSPITAAYLSTPGRITVPAPTTTSNGISTSITSNIHTAKLAVHSPMESSNGSFRPIRAIVVDFPLSKSFSTFTTRFDRR